MQEKQFESLEPRRLFVGTVSEQIIVDQFGWRADAPKKVAIFADPINGQNSAVSYTPGANFQLRRVSDAAMMFTGPTVSWKSGTTDTISGDKVWYGDFSSVTTPGEYYIYDPTNNLRSFAFKLDSNVFNDILKTSIRMYYYQRTGTAIPSQYGGNWIHAISHMGGEVLSLLEKQTGHILVAGEQSKEAPWAREYPHRCRPTSRFVSFSTTAPPATCAVN